MKNDISERFWAGVGAILFGAVILIAVAYFLGWIF